MKSVAIFLSLVSLAGFQAAVLSEEPAPSIPESNQPFLEQLQDQFGKVSDQVTNSMNGVLETIKERTMNIMTYTTDMGKKYGVQKLAHRKFSSIGKDLQYVSQNVLNKVKEIVKDQYKKATDMVDEVKNNPAVVALKEEVATPTAKMCQTAVNWMIDQSAYSIINMLQKKVSM